MLDQIRVKGYFEVEEMCWELGLDIIDEVAVEAWERQTTPRGIHNDGGVGVPRENCYRLFQSGKHLRFWTWHVDVNTGTCWED